MDAGTLELVELDPALDFEHAPLCEGFSSHGEPAEWLGVSCCKVTAYCCDDHKRAQQRWMALNTTTCDICKTQNPEIAWTPIA